MSIVTNLNINTTPEKKRLLSAPVNFKLDLIREVQKYPIIWEDLKGPKNKDFLNNAWAKVIKALKIKEGTPQFPAGYCLRHWKWLLTFYSSHINSGKKMKAVLVEKMEFMKPQLLKSDQEKKSLNQPVKQGRKEKKVSQAKRPKGRAPTAQQASPGPLGAGARGAERGVALAIVNHLFDSLPPAAMTQVCGSLIQVLHTLRPNLSSEVLEFGRQQPDLFNIDWSKLPIPEEICREVWRRELESRLRNSWTESPKQMHK